MTLRSINPANGELIREYPEMEIAAVDVVLERAYRTSVEWRDVALEERCRMLRALGDVLLRQRMVLARIMTTEMGKTLTSACREVEKCARLCDHYADNAAEYLADRWVDTDAARSHVVVRPLGVVLGVMPWNFPLWQAMRFVVPTVTAGNTAVLKHASNVSVCALAIQDVFAEAGYPAGAMATILVPGARVGAVIEDPRVAAVSLTGSERAGRAVGRTAGEMLKPVVLELGGSDPYVVLDDADVAAAAAACVESRLINAGQSCIAAKRMIVTAANRDRFTEAVVERMREAVMGDPFDIESTIGPMARGDLRDDLHDQVQRSTAHGARLLLGGSIPERPGAWYPPTVLTDVAPGLPAHDEELFGPVAAIVPVRDEREALAVANRSRFGLGAAVFTRDVERGERIARDVLDAGCCFVNTYVRSDPRVPFGGVRSSGHGRELSREGIRSFVNVKTIWVA